MLMRKSLITLVSFARNEIEKLCKASIMCADCPADAYGGKCKDEYIVDYLIDHNVIIKNVGQWKYDHEHYTAVCSSCGFVRDLDANFGSAISCPNCGTYMNT